MPAKLRRYQIPPGVIEAEDLVADTIQIAIPIHLFAGSLGFAIDSTGEKLVAGHFEVPAELLKHVKAAYLEAYLTTPSATDATVEVQLYNVKDGTKVATLTYAGEGGFKKSDDISGSLSTLAGKEICGRIEVTTASGTSGATQAVKSIVLVLVLGVS